jgi:hypothetical protein
MKKLVVLVVIATPFVGPWFVSAAGSALASGGSMLFPIGVAGFVLACKRWS